MNKKKNVATPTIKNSSLSENEGDSRIINLIVKFLVKLKNFEIDTFIGNWYQNQSKSAKTAFLSAFIIGFVSHLFIYTGRYFGDHDPGLYWRTNPTIQTGRWFNKVINVLSYGYIMPMIVGIFVTLFLALSAFYICKIFSIEKKINAILIAALLTTFPSIAFTNLFLYDSANYHFGVFLAVLAVFVTIKYKLGFALGAILLMLTLAIYQSKFNIALALCVFYLINHALDKDFSFKSAGKLMLRFFLMSGLAGLFYAISLPIFFRIHDSSFGGHRGFSPESMSERLLSISGLVSELYRAYREFLRSFLGDIYLVINPLLYAYLVLAALAAILLVITIIKYNIHKQPMRLLFILGLLIIIPFTSNFAGFLATNTVCTMIYPFVLVLVSFVIFFDQHVVKQSLMRSTMVVCVFFISANYIISNNAFYLRAFFFNAQMTSLNTRIAGRIDPLLPLIESNPRRYTYFGSLPNEYLHSSPPFFNEHGSVTGGRALGHNSFISPRGHEGWQRNLFALNLRSLHGINLSSLPGGYERELIHEEVLASNMPIWPAEDSVAIINDVIVINFGIADVIYVEDEQYFRARHWINEGYASHEYHWRVYLNDAYLFSSITNTTDLSFDMTETEGSYYVQVQIRNNNLNFHYPRRSITVPIESQ